MTGAYMGPDPGQQTLVTFIKFSDAIGNDSRAKTAPAYMYRRNLRSATVAHEQRDTIRRYYRAHDIGHSGNTGVGAGLTLLISINHVTAMLLF
jgi:hypothetical protein